MLTFAGGGVKATQLTRRVELGCPSFSLGDGQPTVQSLISNVAFYQVNCIKENEII
jgi:hypothetical protein